MKPLVRRIAFATVVLLMPSLLFAEAPNFSVTIVSPRQFQVHDFRSDQAANDKGYPWITIPNKAATNTNLEPDESSPKNEHFYVVVRNLSKNSLRLNLGASDWYDCLEFQVTTPDGKSFTIHRPPTPWVANPIVSWIFQPDGVRVFYDQFRVRKMGGFSTRKYPRENPF